MSARGTGFAERLGVQLPLIDVGDCPHARAESLADILVNIGFNGATTPPSRFRLPSETATRSSNLFHHDYGIKHCGRWQ